MKSMSHILLGHILIDYLQETHHITIKPKSFLWGSILPDFLPTFLTRPHFLENNEDFLKKSYRYLLLKPIHQNHLSVRNSRKLGILCHYYADFFCRAHNNEMYHKLRDHMRYEKHLHRYIREHYERIRRFAIAPRRVSDGAADVSSTYRHFTELHYRYICSVPSYGEDIVYTLMSCTEMMVSLVSGSQSTNHPVDPTVEN